MNYITPRPHKKPPLHAFRAHPDEAKLESPLLGIAALCVLCLILGGIVGASVQTGRMASLICEVPE